MDKRFTIFAILVALIFVVNQVVYLWLFPPQPQPPGAVPKAVAKTEPGKPAGAQAQSDKKEAKPDELQPPPRVADDDKQGAAPQASAADKVAENPPAIEAAPTAPLQYGTLGSADPNSPYRMLVLWTNRGAAIESLELNSPRYRDLEDRSGFLGSLALADAPGKKGAQVRVVGAGTPAAAAGVQAGDIITALGDTKVATAGALVEALKATEPGDSVRIVVRRGEAERQLTARLERRPLAVMRPELDNKPLDVLQPGIHDPFSFLMTIQQFDDRTIDDDQQELKDVKLRSSEWEVVASNQDVVSFRKTLPKMDLQVTKTYRLEPVPADQQTDEDYPAYNLSLDVSIANVGSAEHKVAYRLDGPTGLPIEGAWYASKVSRSWSAAGLRDIITHFHGGVTEQITPMQLSEADFKTHWPDSPLDYTAVDAQYFSAALIPQKEKVTDVLFADVRAIRVGSVPQDKNDRKLVNVSFRLDSKVVNLEPNGKPLEHRFQIFTGPKKPALLEQYRPPGAAITLRDLLYYGWFGFVAQPMLVILHLLHRLVANYALAIILLTVIVRGGMFPLSRKQALGAQKMQELQPELKKINEKFKNEPEKKTKATQELFRQYNYNPVGGCLLVFIQTPIFVGLYRSLMVDVELRQAALFGQGIRWASNLAAPDMFWNWSHIVPHFVAFGNGFLALGPYLNIFPLFTIALFIWQQKMFMPPPADEQAALQQKMMQYMMIFMGIMFFKVASGLCVYFIASSIWGICERKLLPKAKPATAGGGGSSGTSSGASGPSGNGAPSGKKRQRGRK